MDTLFTEFTVNTQIVEDVLGGVDPQILCRNLTLSTAIIGMILIPLMGRVKRPYRRRPFFIIGSIVSILGFIARFALGFTLAFVFCFTLARIGGVLLGSLLKSSRGVTVGVINFALALALRVFDILLIA